MLIKNFGFSYFMKLIEDDVLNSKENERLEIYPSCLSSIENLRQLDSVEPV